MSLDVQGDQSSSDRTVTRPMNGDEYIESLRDGRQIYIHGERVEDVTTHPAFRNSVRSIARLYNALHDPATKDELTTETDTGSGGYTHPFFKAPHSAADLVAGRDAIAAWQRLTYGWMGRSPDYKAAFLATYGPNADYYAPFAGQRAPLVQGVPGARVLHEPHAREPAGRPRQGDPRGLRRLHPRGQGDRRGRRRARREDGRHRLGAVELQLRLLPRQRADQEGGVRALLLRADGPPEHQAAVPARPTSSWPRRSAARSTTRSRAASTRTTRC